VRFALAFVCALAACGCQAVNEGPSRAASSDPIAATEATERGDWKDAADRWFAVYLADTGKSAHPIVQSAHALLMLKDLENANSMVDLGMKEHPDDPELLEMKGLVLVSMSFRRPAEKYFQRAIEIDPKRPVSLLALGRARIELGLESAAIAPLQEVLRLQGGSFETYSLLARALKGSGDPSGSYVAWKKAFEFGGSSIEDMLTASALSLDPDVRRQQPDAAAVCRGWLEKAIAMDPQCTTAHFQLGVLSEETGAYDAAIEHYRRAVETDPSCLIALRNLAVLYSGRSDEAKTREMVQRALQLEQDADRRRALLKLLDPFTRK